MADINRPEPGQAVTSTTEVTPHPADETSAPVPMDDMSPDRPPVSTTQPDVPIAHSLIAGAGAGNQNVGEPEADQAAERAGEPQAEEPTPKKAAK
jgi:hypothetical protein